MKKNILLVGVGGQGILTLAAILGKAAVNAGINVIGAETHGMAQRGGSVEVHIRLGDVLAPLIPIGGADIVVALEPVEALRYVHYLNEKTTVVINTRKIIPLSASIENKEYPSIDEITQSLKKLGCRVYALDATSIAEMVAKPQSANVVMIGALSKVAELPFDIQHLELALKQVLPKKLHEMNLKALKSGYDALVR